MKNLNLDKDSLEKALSFSKTNSSESAQNPETPQISKEEEIGFHKGCLNTLAAERNEFVKIIMNVEAIMQAHLKRLEELGVKIEREE